ncbi:MAG: sigma-70 family RNA polymerase sigma factor [Candidatus Peribacteraceae bacterium]|nr:sigma-70 family RNA polymerase sigma factor [Candidatus Peribacteraceae bacterium]
MGGTRSPKAATDAPSRDDSERNLCEEILVQELIDEAGEITVRFFDDPEKTDGPEEDSRLLESHEEQVLLRYLCRVREEFREAVISCGAEEILNLLDVEEWLKEFARETFYMDYSEENAVTVPIVRKKMPLVRRKLQQLHASLQKLIHSHETAAQAKRKEIAAAIESLREKIFAMLEQYPLRMSALFSIAKKIKRGGAGLADSQSTKKDGEIAESLGQTREEVAGALERIETSGAQYHEAAHTLLAFNLRLITDQAHQFHARYGDRIDLEDLKQQGIMAFRRAMETIDERKVSTYSTEWIISGMQNAITREARGFIGDNPSRKHKRWQAIKKQKRLEEGENGKLTKAQKKLIVTGKPALSLTNSAPGKTKSVGDFITSSLPPADARLDQVELRETLDKILLRLRKREELIIRMRMGLPWRQGLQPFFPQKTEGYTQVEVGDWLDVGYQAVQQQEWRILEKLRGHSKNPSLRAFVGGDLDE